MDTNPRVFLFSLLLLLVFTNVYADSANPGGNLIAIITSGDITDFGFNNNVNIGRINMERALNISGSYFATNILDQDSCLALMKQLAAKGFKLMISTTTAHVNAPIIAAGLFPNITFVMNGGTSTLPNLSSLSFSGPDLYFAAGVFSGAMSTANKVGFVHPGPPLASIGTLNAFYVGVKSINPNCEVLTVFTDSYLNPDRTVGACKILLGKGVDMLVGQQDDLTLINEAIDAGFLGVGTNGYPLRNIYGESIGVSVLRNWGGPFTTYANGTLQNLNTVFRKDVSGAFSTGYTYLDIPSHLVPDAVWANVQAGVVALKGKTKPYYCTSYVAEMGVNTTTNCLLNNTVFTSQILSDINYLGTYHVPLETVTFPKPASIAIITISGVLYIATVTVAIFIIIFRRDTVMLAGSPVFLGLVLIGVALCFTAAIVWVTEPSEHICASRIWLPSIGITLCMGAMIIKNIRLMIIFDAQLRRVRIRNSRLLLFISMLLIIDIILLAVWNGLGKLHVFQQQGIEGLGTYQVRNICRSARLGDQLLYAIISWHVAQLAVGCFVTFKIRVIDIEEFNESRPFGISIYLVSFVTTIAGILVGTADTTNVQRVIIVSLSFLIGASAVLFLLFAPKFLIIMMKGTRSLDKFLGAEMNQRRGAGKTSTKTSSNSSSKNNTNNTTNKSRSNTSLNNSSSADSVVSESKEREEEHHQDPNVPKNVSVVVI